MGDCSFLKALGSKSRMVFSLSKETRAIAPMNLLEYLLWTGQLVMVSSTLSS